MSNTTKGGLIGGTSGTALGALVGNLVGGSHKGTSTAIGAAVGAAVGTTAGVLIGKKMDKAKAAAEAIEGAEVESVTDNNGLQAVKVTFDSGILFASGNSTLNTTAKASLSKFANNVLKQNTDMDVSIYGYTDNQGWKNSTAEQSTQKNLNLSQERAQSVSTYLLSCGVASSQVKSVEGLGEANPVASNDTAEGREQNRRVEVYLYASSEMIQQAEAGTL
jgi:outer membrane protein OmpA-like peptidoglycan-associated protein